MLVMGAASFAHSRIGALGGLSGASGQPDYF